MSTKDGSDSGMGRQIRGWGGRGKSWRMALHYGLLSRPMRCQTLVGLADVLGSARSNGSPNFGSPTSGIAASGAEVACYDPPDFRNDFIAGCARFGGSGVVDSGKYRRGIAGQDDPDIVAGAALA